jgi:hypothetical protein
MSHKTRYDAIFERIQRWPHEWVEITPEDVNGKFSGQKQGCLIQAAKNRGLQIKTSYKVGQPFLVCIDHTTVPNE